MGGLTNEEQTANDHGGSGAGSSANNGTGKRRAKKDDDGTGADGEEDGGRKKKAKRRKVDHACVYCRRSHMTCDSGRPCQRCIKREIGHLCHDEIKPAPKEGPTNSTPAAATPTTPVAPTQQQIPQPAAYSAADNNLPYNIQPLNPPPNAAPVSNWPIVPNTFYGSQNSGNEFSVLTDFLQSLDDRSFFGTPQNILPTSAPQEISLVGPGSAQQHPNHNAPPVQQHHAPVHAQQPVVHHPHHQESHPHPLQHQPQPSGLPHPQHLQQPQQHTAQHSTQQSQQHQQPQQHAPPQQHQHQQPHQHPSQAPAPPSPILPAATKTEQFLLTAADQESGTRDERLNKVIHSKYEAGLLKPYNYVKGYARLSRWMDRNVAQESKQQILGPLSVLRPKFRAIAQSLTDMDLVFIEEAFERLLLDYDRVFSAMGIPACLWRRTGEIYKGNREFAELVGVDGHMLRDGRLCIYELMAEESAVNYWEKYGHVAFDAGQKAVLTSCVLRFKPNIAAITGAANIGSSSSSVIDSPSLLRGGYSNSKRSGNIQSEQGLINCCFSFTIRRDAWGIPSMIVGNFIRH
ncbi:hypothetical protein M422DRAFT_232009 [Sphaerobolus stellatus SS14]|uniref:Zn(2)-C6 fungal-type domain-containing protein n=1 Tax=Sphaerobolus stellatus (strain SS14) TaxID=990650 RepID=A0A0C9U2I2_SPHS4|nr:hypothetical protein M422DRAFT_232009 [Sphaerobolus stellatus SS14]